MEAIGLSIFPKPTISPSNYSKCISLNSPIAYTFKLPDSFNTQFNPLRKTQNWRVVRMQVVGEEYELKQMKDMAAARKRWEALVRSGKVKALTPREAGYAIQLSSKTLLDVRPESERTKAWVKGSDWIPIFDVDNGLDVGSLSKKASNFMMGGWWSGVPTLSYNNQFISKVQEKFPKDTDLIVACQKGLRSLAACELLCNAGYENVFWVQGGLEAADEKDFEREGPQPFKFAGIGGLSEFLGWTDQQRAAAAKEGWQYRLVFSARLIGLIFAADALFLAVQQVLKK
ncbi:rhodanese-like domain-containing protein 11, chloroplastic [Silene latifolia]|uniref:rhodanese-like domain-containing protein 11, chloroplastic n=1 Tax=Silene latifolia TaxID=37657 RepID=UPI003D76B634